MKRPQGTCLFTQVFHHALQERCWGQAMGVFVFFFVFFFFETTKNTFMKLKKEVEKKEMGKGEALPQWNN